ncbi:hypothetical protein HS048_25565 [Planomonospora sp. ID91781]|uniref:hypothetical protein n=1 Tax=Planomonospora sp. ID91781 TaxID=2738135 RepID=UPI0018C38827|nr:hypothetical protein [Planomonospora sp. ID91781]MBG0824083.1 hypothetical protein [Planomonospora sp. ID91781]
MVSGRLERSTCDTGDEMHGEHGPTPRSVRRGRMPYDDSPPEFSDPPGHGGQDGTVTLPRFPGKGTRARPRTLRGGLSGPVLVGGFLLLAGAGGLSSVWLGEAGPSAAPGHGSPLPAAPPAGDGLGAAPGNADPVPAPSLTSRGAPSEGPSARPHAGAGKEPADGSPPGAADGLPPGAEAGSSARITAAPEAAPSGAAVVERPRPAVTAVRGDGTAQGGSTGSTGAGGTAAAGRGPGGAAIKPAVPPGRTPPAGTRPSADGRPPGGTGPSGGRPPSAGEDALGDGPVSRGDGAGFGTGGGTRPGTGGGGSDGADALDQRFSSAYVCRRLPRGDWRHAYCVQVWEDFRRTNGLP